MDADRKTEGTRWSYCRDNGNVRLIVLDSRAGRVLDPGKRTMVDEEEWDWFVEHVKGDFDHLLIASSLPFLLPGGEHGLEAWNEAVAEGAWGKRASRMGEKVRQALDLEHWAAFRRSFERMSALLEEVASGKHGKPPATVVLLSGDVHHAYLAEVAFRKDVGAHSAVYQATCSPFRNGLSTRERAMVRFASGRVGHAMGSFLCQTARRPAGADPLADRRGPVVRQPGRDAHARRPLRPLPAREDPPRRLARGDAPRRVRAAAALTRR